ncbi:MULTISPECIES: ABC transporter substrate-binding protein [unclassified Pseudodesulfovibrio]|uniref:ABC transporter substrate-binding protein n=1 Tax=unclassified Pseudodesulfovibrio TaxID=2661612 RepID=UPI001F4F34BB|nr:MULTISPECIES: ABC transporter substrate-binding protein [unclassified Pseudodesulfovibrio]MCJ2163401.1 ABC transporter substrate-binding protein [Pseudodesulfovibrio sp. S3-i]
MQPNSVYLAIAPNILRKTVQDLSRMDFDLDLIPPQTHQEMLDFSVAYGNNGSVPGLSMCAYPQFLHNVLQHQSTGTLAALPDSLPPMRRELTALGMAEPSRHFRVVCFVPFVIAASTGLNPPVEDWEDLCRPEIAEHVAVPPHDTPMPDLFDTMMRTLYGQRAEAVIAAKNTDYTPLDINKRIDSGEFLAGLNIPAFSRTYREGNGRMVWPRSGAWAVPLMVTIRRDASPDATRFLHYLLSNEYQTYLADSGCLVPVVEGIPWFTEMADNNGRLQWPGWDALAALGRPNAE